MVHIPSPLPTSVPCLTSCRAGAGAVCTARRPLDRPANNSNASAVLISTALPDRPHLLLPVLAYGLLQKAAANQVMRKAGQR